MLTHFYDIESLENAFTLCNFKPDQNLIDIYFLVDDDNLINVPNFEQQLLTLIYKENHNFRGAIKLYNLKEQTSNIHLAKTFGLSDSVLVNDPAKTSSYPQEFRLVCDTDPGYTNEKYPYLMGYNSFNYDTTELTMYFHEVFPIIKQYANSAPVMMFQPTTAKRMREYNDELFLPEFKSSMPTRLTKTWDSNRHTWSAQNYKDPRFRIRKNMLLSGRHLDVAKLNEKQAFVGLKRLLGMLGHQILESGKLKAGVNHLDTAEQFMDLIAYNISDCVNLEELFSDRLYQGQFKLKKALLDKYPELVYDRIRDEYKPDIRPERVRKDRLFIDSSSAQLATKALCPYDHLTDIPVVSFMYPSEEKAKEFNIPRVNVLEESKKFFYGLFDQPEIRAKFDIIYDYYKNIEGKNFNESDNYRNDYQGTPDYHTPHNLAKMAKVDMCMFYYLKNGDPSTCFVTFSTGGIHGAECNKTLFEHHTEQFEKELKLLNHVKDTYPDPLDLKVAKGIVIDGIKYPPSKFLKTGSTLKTAFYKDLDSKRPQLFKTNNKGATALNKKYVFTSADHANHEDFTSYYPNMLRMMYAFFNEGLGYDRYAEIFDDKQLYGQLMKDKTKTDAERDSYAILREGTKLILNSASGAADATFESNIRMNNQIISMRIIGQLFSWRIGQAQTVHGARITSTNTDGLYSVLDPEINNPILEKESESIGVEIEPEPLFLISKDSNNRIDLDITTGKILSASGGTLACHGGPSPTKSLSHPALLDWALAEYLIFVSMPNKRKLTLATPFSDEAGMNILMKACNMFEPRKFLTMTQNVIASSPSSMTYAFALNHDDHTKPHVLQHYNRTFIMKDETPGTVHLANASAKKITPATILKRKRDESRPQIHDPIARIVLELNGVNIENLPIDKEATVKKITNVENNWHMLIQNRALIDLSTNEAAYTIDNLDLTKYLTLLRSCFEKNWRNKMPGDPDVIVEDDENEECEAS